MCEYLQNCIDMIYSAYHIICSIGVVCPLRYWKVYSSHSSLEDVAVILKA